MIENMKTVAIVQARMSSSRLPGKVLLDITGQPMLARVVARVRRARRLDGLVVATTTDPSDDALTEFCQRNGIESIRGSQFDVLDRYYQAASRVKADVIVRNRDMLGENSTMCALAGTIGTSAAGDMAAFLSLEKGLLDVRDIIKEPTKVDVPSDIAAQLMIMFQAVDTLDNQDDLSSFMEFVERIKSSEVQAIFFTMMMRGSKSVRIAAHNKKITDWAASNHDLF